MTLPAAISRLRDYVTRANLDLVRNGLVVWTGGNASARVPGAELMLIKPSGIDASSAPGWVERLKSGRLVFVWNRSKLEGAEKTTSFWSGQAHEVPAPGHREELSIAFSEDDGQSWTAPVVLMRVPNGQLAYPYVLERTPGELWVMTRYTFLEGGKPAPPVKVRILEKDFVKPRE